MKNKRLAERTAEEKNLVKLELDTLVRHGAQEILAKALEIEVELYLEKYQYILDDAGNRRVIKNGAHRPRVLLTGAGPL